MSNISEQHVASLSALTRAQQARDGGFSVADLRELPGILRRRRVIVMMSALLAMLAAIAYALMVKPSYVSTTRLLIDPRGIQVVERDLTPRAPAGEMSLSVVESQMMVVASDGVLKRVIEKLDLVSDPEFSRPSGLMNWIRGVLPATLTLGPMASDPIVRTLAAVRKAIRVERLQNSFIIDLSVTTEDRHKSPRIANEIVSHYVNQEIANREGMAERATLSLTTRLSELKDKVRESEEKVERYKQVNNIVIIDGNPFSDQELARLNEQLAQLRAQAAQAQARAEQIERALRSQTSVDSIAEAVQSPTIAQMRSRLSVAQQQVATLKVGHLPSHPAMIAARARLTEATDNIRSELDRIARAARADWERAAASERELTEKLDLAKRDHGTADQARVQLRELERNAQASRAVYEAFLMRTRELGEQKAIDPTNVRVISPAVIPTEPKGLRLAFLLPLSCLAGLGLGSLLALTSERFDPIIQTAHHAEAIVDVPVHSVMLRGLKRTENLSAIINDFPQTKSAHDLRKLLASIGGVDPSHSPRLVLVTATGEQVGKTTVAYNLALAAMETGERVLLVDGDPTRRQVTILRALDAQNGIADVLQNHAGIEHALVRDTTGIEILPAAQSSVPAARRYAANMMTILVDRCTGFDLVVIDGGLIGIDVSIAAFANIVDDIVLVARIGATSGNELSSGMVTLGAQKSRVRAIALVEA